MYNINRQEASEILGVSIRSIDRYIKSGKIRAKKIGKVVMLNDNDLKILSGEEIKQKIIIKNKTEEITENNIEKKEAENSGLVKKAEYEKILSTFDKMFTTFREEIKEKDSKIQELSIELGQIREQKNNSIDLMEYKKSQFLSEEAKKSLTEKLEKEQKEKEQVLNSLKYEKTTNKLLIIFLIILFIVSAGIFFINI